jgi:hypothetical protein
MTEAKHNQYVSEERYKWRFEGTVELDPKYRYSSFGEIMGTVEEYEEYKRSVARGDKWITYAEWRQQRSSE